MIINCCTITKYTSQSWEREGVWDGEIKINEIQKTIKQNPQEWRHGNFISAAPSSRKRRSVSSIKMLHIQMIFKTSRMFDKRLIAIITLNNLNSHNFYVRAMPPTPSLRTVRVRARYVVRCSIIKESLNKYVVGRQIYLNKFRDYQHWENAIFFSRRDTRCKGAKIQNFHDVSMALTYATITFNDPIIPQMRDLEKIMGF